MLWYSLTGELSHSCPMLSFSCFQAHGATNDPAECSETGEIFRWTLLWDAWMILSTHIKLTQFSTFGSALPRVITWHISLNYSRRLYFVSWVNNSIRNPTPSTGGHMCMLQRRKVLLLSQMCFWGLNSWMICSHRNFTHYPFYSAFCWRAVRACVCNNQINNDMNR